MKIAITSQNRREITEHAGRCRKFWVYNIDHGAVTEKNLLELPKEQSFHESSPHTTHPLDGVDVLISRSMGQGMLRRLAGKGILGIIAEEQDPDAAIEAWLNGTLQVTPPDQGCHHH